MQNYTFQDKAIALIGIYQASQCVYELATTGKTDPLAYETCVNALFCDNPETTLSVYGNEVNNIQKGTESLLAQMQAANTMQTRNMELTKYVLTLIILERKLFEQKQPLEKISRVLESAKNNRSQFGDFHENVIATIARAYSENVSVINPRIMVNGHHEYLQNPKIANKIRALLLSGIRSALLWRQVGGSRWGLIWHRKKYAKAAQSLYRPQEAQSEHN